MGRNRLGGFRVAVLAADGFEQIELTVPLKRLRREGAEVEVISLRPGKIRGMNLLFPGKKVRVDRLLHMVEASDYDALLLPGGFINPDVLRQSESARAFVRAFDTVGKPIAVICHGPWLLASAGLVRGRRLTSWPGIKDDLINAGATWQDAAVVHDAHWVSSRGPHDLPAFTKAMVKLFTTAVPEGAQTAREQHPSLIRWLAGGAVALAAGYATQRFTERRVRTVA